ncbi:MAG: hypothetical protein JXB48_14540 [Candidatus Latescibacteria bacterium]|nr:hypothetical protein [Candidatus Latescibacterota bacterium]
MRKKIIDWYIHIVQFFELILALVVLCCVVVFGLGSFFELIGMDWKITTTFYELIYRVLLMVIGLELVRMLLTHEIFAVLELLAFVIARKMLMPDLTSIDIVLAVIAFVSLLAARKFLFNFMNYSKEKFLPVNETDSKNQS